MIKVCYPSTPYLSKYPLPEKYDPLANKGIAPGTRVMVGRLQKGKIVGDEPATVLCHYGRLAEDYGQDLILGPYPSSVDVVFDDGIESKGHFTWGVKLLF